MSLAGSNCTLEHFCSYIIESEGLGPNDFIIASGTKVFRPSSYNLQSVSLQNNSHVDILIPLAGGKGGFGSLLRAIGAQIEKTTNRDACRDLSGRRLRDIKREEELKKLYALRDKLQEERKRKKQEKLEKLKKRTSEIANDSKSLQELVQMFDDHEYNKRRLALGDIINAAVEKGIINSKKRRLEDSEHTNDPVKKTRKDEKDETEHSQKEEKDTSSKRELDSVRQSSQVDVSDDDEDANNQDIWLGLEDEAC